MIPIISTVIQKNFKFDGNFYRKENRTENSLDI